MNHKFTENIKEILADHFEENAELVFQNSTLIQYLNKKTKAAYGGSKTRSSFGNIYALFVLIEDYINKGFSKNAGYAEYEGAKFSDLFTRQRELPFGAKLQNHALNQRLNREFAKFFPAIQQIPILRDVEKQKYWINEHLLNIHLEGKNINIQYNISEAIIDIINAYIEARQGSFTKFIETCEELKTIAKKDASQINEFVLSLLEPLADARIFEITSYSILKYYYYDQTVFFGFEMEEIEEENLKLYKTGRTNANDGGIDFVMKPLGRFFQVTETTDVKKYFLDIEKIERYPVTFVIKSEEEENTLTQMIETGAKELFSVNAIVKKYLDAVEELINLPKLRAYFDEAIQQGYAQNILDEIIIQSKVEFNLD